MTLSERTEPTERDDAKFTLTVALTYFYDFHFET